MNKKDFVKDCLLGIAIGDALGVPVEFVSRKGLSGDPVIGMKGYGSHNQPAGTWSDDSALTFCLAEMLCEKYDLQNLANRFVNWEKHGYWTAHGTVFDMGIATSSAIDRLARGMTPVLAGGDGEGSNGNGSLMRILPLIFFSQDKDIDERFRLTKEVSSLTHRHIRSIISCFIYLEFALELIRGENKLDAYHHVCSTVKRFLGEKGICPDTELPIFFKILSGNIFALDETEIKSSGYVIHTLEASIWCLLNTSNYRDAVLKAVNLGDDADTTGAVTGGLAGLYYGWETVPAEWLKKLARREDIENLSNSLTAKIQ